MIAPVLAWPCTLAARGGTLTPTVGGTTTRCTRTAPPPTT